MSRGDPTAAFHPVVRGWFRSTFERPTEAQERGWPSIAAGRDTLIAAPTGSGKTLAAFLACIDRLVRAGLRGELAGGGVEVLYVSPLKALSNDVHRNLEIPLEGIREHAAREGIGLPPIRVALRTGDTPASERAKLAKNPPQILVTTPESLYLLLTAEKSRAVLRGVKTVIVDEIHAVARDKRGAHLGLSLARLDRLVQSAGQRGPTRVGLSATQKPMSLIARLLAGTRRDPPVPLDGGHARHIDIALETTDDELSAIASNEEMGRVYDRVAELVREHETTLVFVNTRRLVERVAHALEERLGEEQVVAHHGSLSRQLRFDAEQKLKSGSVRCAVATASLELGIDVGSVDLVVQIGSPRSIATLLQRIGRSGHSLGKTPKGRLFALTRDQLAESAALIRAVRKRELDAVDILPAPLDVLAQQIVAEVAASESCSEDELYEMARATLHYEELPRERFDSVIHMLSEGISTRRGRRSAHLHRDRIAGRVTARRGARLAALTCGGAIPDNFNYPVVTFPEETPVGSLDEDFAIESNAGDIFLLGNTSWRILRVEAARVLVEDARGAPPNIPFWVGEAPARTRELSAELAELRESFGQRIEAGDSEDELAAWIEREAQLPPAAAEQLAGYWLASHRALGALPSQRLVIAERFFDDGGGMQLVLHSPFGGRINKAWGLALRKRFCRSFNLELQAAATDDGIVISLGPPHSFALEEVFAYLKADTVRHVLGQAVLGAPVFGTRWRWNATRSLAVLRRRGGKKVPPAILRLQTDDLLSTVFPMQQACLENVVGDIEVPDHPLVEETMRDCLSEFMDVDGLAEVIGRIESGDIQVLARDTAQPSPLCHELLSANPYAFLDDVPLEERRTRAMSLPRSLEFSGQRDLCALPARAVSEAEGEASPVVRSREELHDHLLSLYLVPASGEWARHAAELIAGGRAHEVSAGARRFLVASERWPLVRAALPPSAAVSPEPRELPFEVEEADSDTATALIVRGHMELLGPRTPAALAVALGLPEVQVHAAMLALEADGVLLPGSFTAEAQQVGAREWCDRRMLQRVHRLTIGALRREIEPVCAAALHRFLCSWQRVGGGARLIGVDGLHRLVEQLQGFETAAGAWEREILPARMHDYQSDWLDTLSYGGQVSWARLSPKSSESTHHAPTSSAPLTLYLRPCGPWLRAPAARHEAPALGALATAVRDELERRGATFLSDLVEATGSEPRHVEDALWELVGAGLATADGFAPLRLLIQRRGVARSRFDAGNRSGQVSSRRWQQVLRNARTRDSQRRVTAVQSLATSAGRWSIIGEPDLGHLDADAHARQLLCRYGVVFRDLLARESALPPWRDLLSAFRRMEARGELRGGRFVSGFTGEQFALPEAVQGLRAARARGTQPVAVRIAATDPLNLVGVLSPGPRVPAVIGNAVLYVDGVPVASLEAGEVTVRNELPEGARVDGDLVYHAPPATGGERRQLSLLTVAERSDSRSA